MRALQLLFRHFIFCAIAGLSGLFSGLFSAVLLVVFLVVSMGTAAQAQQSTASLGGGSGGGDEKSQSNYVAPVVGPILPANIPGVSEIVEVLGVKVGTHGKFGNVEIQGFGGNGSGQSYNSVGVNYRPIFKSEFANAHALIGMHMDITRAAGSSKLVQAGGWQVGGGLEMDMFGPIAFLTDFEFRISPGRSLLVSSGFLMRF